MSKISDIAIFRNLKVAAGALIYITDSETGALEPLYSNPAMTVSKSNPMVTDSDGAWEAYIDPGTYDIRAVKDGYEYIILNVGVDISSAPLSAAGSILTNLDRANTLIDGDPIVTVLNWEVFASGSDSATASFVVEIPEDIDVQEVYTSGEYTSIANGTWNMAITGTVGLSTTDVVGGASAVVKLQKYVSSWTDVETLATLSATSGSPDSSAVNYDSNLTLDIGQKLRIYYDLTPSSGTDTCTASGFDVAFTYQGE